MAIIKRSNVISVITVLLLFGFMYFLRNTVIGDIYGRTVGKLYEGPSKQTFTLSGEVPTYFSLDIISYYQNDRADECLRYSAKAGKRMSYFTGMKQTVEMSDKGHYEVNVPTSYYAAGCHLPIQSVKIVAYEYYDKDLKETTMEQWAASLSFVNSDQLADEAPHFSLNKPMIYNSRCSNMLRIMGGDLLVKILGCYNVDQHWQWIQNNKTPKVYDVLRRDELPNQSITVNLRHDPYDDVPYYGKAWEQIRKNWKPCYGKGKNDPFGFCYNSPGKYRIFKMNGKTCTIYPQCTEDEKE